MVLPMLLPSLNRPQPQNPQRPVMHDGNPRPEELAVPVAWLYVVGTPHVHVSMAHFVQERTDHALKGVLRPRRPSFSEYHARIQLDSTLSFFAAQDAMAQGPGSAWDGDVGAPLDGDVVVESAAEEDEVEVREGFYGDVGAGDETFFGFGGGEEKSTDCGFFEGGNGSFDVVLPHHFFCCFPTCCEWAFVGDREDVPSVEVDVPLAAGVGCARVYAEGLEGLLE